MELTSGWADPEPMAEGGIAGLSPYLQDRLEREAIPKSGKDALPPEQDRLLDQLLSAAFRE
ncbi:hypothetical protein Q4511_09270 [Paracoccus sp. 1_MG-2023]|uniref:hypothetical protein n=1 Tax=unclassified Paracoccus (in: a-proteobacteria) TaxID=2688777 RepID=UPI001C0902D0|nr:MULTISPECIES: hypothetical protein [unclassified Paracoccus (in: a-proteobacteria)]MBU2957225.1 hypothetical protein [Paracoccus sp. C2R09]MDO6669112.1 hypothetical protein [Paracoccus sp. 1_MG-2023]